MSLPKFLVIGAMKSATTTLYHDLATHPQVFLAEKELGALTHDVSTSEYASYFKKARPDQLCGDVSTTYSMCPHVSGVADRAKRMLSSNIKILYLVREPVARTISHHFHYYSMRTHQRMEADIDVCVRKYPSLTNYGRYGEQLEEWTRRFGEPAIHVVQFEEYINDRWGTLAEILRILGLRPLPECTPLDSIRNASAGKPILNGFGQWLTQQPLYRRLARPWLPLAVRDQIRAAVLPTAPQPPPPPRPQTIDQLLSVFVPDCERLQRLTNRSRCFWHFDTVRAAHIERYRQWQRVAELRKSA